MDSEDQEYIYEDEVEEEILLDENEDDILVDGIEEATLEDYDADSDEDDDINSGEGDETCITTFRQHDGPVFVVDVDGKNGKLVVSGGEDEIAYVWNIETGETIFTCDGHKDSVTCACFNADSTMVATGDMSGFIQAWDIESKKRVWKFETGDLEWLQWHPVASVLLAGTQDGQVWMWQVPKDNCKTYVSHGLSTQSGKFLVDGKSAVVGYEDGTLKVLNLKTTEVSVNIKGKDAHAEGISDIAISADGSLIATASIDGTAKLISPLTGKISATYDCNNHEKDNKENSNLDNEKESVECVAFSPSLSLLATGCLNGYLDIWDYKSGLLRHSCKHEQGITKLVWDAAHRGGSRVYTGCLDGGCRAWDGRNGHFLQTFRGAADHIYDLRISRTGEYLISASADGAVRVFKIREINSASQR